MPYGNLKPESSLMELLQIQQGREIGGQIIDEVSSGKAGSHRARNDKIALPASRRYLDEAFSRIGATR